MPGIEIDRELPVRSIPAIDKWSENYLFVGFDEKTSIGFFTHLGRWSVDSTYWREQIMVFLPGGEVVANRAYGRGDETNGPAGSLLSYSTEDGASWRLHYRGPAQRSSATAMASGPFQENRLHLLDFDVRFTGTHRIWDLGEMAKGEIGFSSHYEQPGSVEGSIRFADQTYAIAGVGHRDHSRGPRDLTTQVSHRWLQGHFPDGLSFALMDSEVLRDDRLGETMSIAILWDDDRIIAGKFSGIPRLDLDADPLKPYDIRIESELGVMDISAQPQTTSRITVDADCECYFGSAPEAGHFAMLDQPTIYHLNGQKGVGHAQRSMRFLDPAKQ